MTDHKHGVIMDIKDIIEKLRSPAWEHRYFAATTLGKTKIDESVDYLIELLDDPNENVRDAAVISLGKIGDPTAIEPLVTALADPNYRIRLHIVEALGEIGDTNISIFLAQFIENEEDENVRATIIKTIGRLGDPKMIPIIANYLNDDIERVRANTIEALENFDTKDTIPLVAPLLNDSNNRVKANAIKFLLKKGKDQLNVSSGYKELEKMITSENEWMRASAAFVLGEIKDKNSVLLLLSALPDQYWFVNKNIVKSLTSIGDTALDHLKEYIENKSNKGRSYALQAFGEICEDKTSSVIISALNDEDGELRQIAEELLAKLD